jgi:hypothetical protein
MAMFPEAEIGISASKIQSTVADARSADYGHHESEAFSFRRMSDPKARGEIVGCK